MTWRARRAHPAVLAACGLACFTAARLEPAQDRPASRRDVLRAERERLIAEVAPILDVSLLGVSKKPTDGHLEEDVTGLYVAAFGLGIETPLEGPSSEERRNVNVRDPRSLTDMIGRIRLAEQRLQDRLTRTERELTHRWTPAHARERLAIRASLRFWASQREQLTTYLERPVSPELNYEQF